MLLIVGSGSAVEKAILNKIKEDKVTPKVNGLQSVNRYGNEFKGLGIRSLPCLIHDDGSIIESDPNKIAKILFNRQQSQPQQQPRRVDRGSILDRIEASGKRQDTNHSDRDLASILIPRWTGDINGSDC